MHAAASPRVRRVGAGRQATVRRALSRGISACACGSVRLLRAGWGGLADVGGHDIRSSSVAAPRLIRTATAVESASLAAVDCFLLHLLTDGLQEIVWYFACRLLRPLSRTAVAYLHMGPMTFTEFLRAVDEGKLTSLITAFEFERDLDPVIHNRLMELLRTYFVTGGMPEAVQAFARSRRLRDVIDVHNSIIDTYREDFPKYVGSRSLPRIVNVFNFTARNVGKKVKYIHFSREDKAATIREDIELLCMARVLSKVVHSHSNGLPLQADAESRVYKLIFMDIGLMNAVCGLGWTAIESMSDSRLVNEGAMAEQFIGQHLRDLLAGTLNRELTYWLREGRATNAEIDYVAAFDGRVVPIEVKAGTSGSLKSLHQFVAEKGVSLAVRFDAAPPSIQTVRTSVQRGGTRTDVTYRLISLPLYLVERLPSLLAALPR